LLAQPADERQCDAMVALAGGSAFVGHLFPVWLKFNGGKGVATFYGVLLSAFFSVGALAAVTWIAMAFLFRMSSLAALTAAALAPLFALAVDAPRPIDRAGGRDGRADLHPPPREHPPAAQGRGAEASAQKKAEAALPRPRTSVTAGPLSDVGAGRLAASGQNPERRTGGLRTSAAALRLGRGGRGRPARPGAALMWTSPRKPGPKPSGSWRPATGWAPG
jgi:hypothetical protein